jgi:hypothetical protein
MYKVWKVLAFDSRWPVAGGGRPQSSWSWTGKGLSGLRNGSSSALCEPHVEWEDNGTMRVVCVGCSHQDFGSHREESKLPSATGRAEVKESGNLVWVLKGCTQQLCVESRWDGRSKLRSQVEGYHISQESPITHPWSLHHSSALAASPTSHPKASEARAALIRQEKGRSWLRALPHCVGLTPPANAAPCW